MIKTLKDIGVISSVDDAYLLTKSGTALDCYDAAKLAKVASFDVEDDSTSVIYFDFPYVVLHYLDSNKVCFINFEIKINNIDSQA